MRFDPMGRRRSVLSAGILSSRSSPYPPFLWLAGSGRSVSSLGQTHHRRGARRPSPWRLTARQFRQLRQPRCPRARVPLRRSLPLPRARRERGRRVLRVVNKLGETPLHVRPRQLRDPRRLRSSSTEPPPLCRSRRRPRPPPLRLLRARLPRPLSMTLFTRRRIAT